MRAAVIQLSSQDDVGANLERVRVRVTEAARAGAELVALPENFAFMGDEAQKRTLAESTGDDDDRTSDKEAGPITKAITALAKANSVWIVAGGMPEASGDAARPFNTSLLAAPDGRIVARYRKIHLFDVDLPDGTKLLESSATQAGADPIVSELPLSPTTNDVATTTTTTMAAAALTSVKLGMTICYDLRFPELYRMLVARGARVVTVPAAFTLTTGKDHWHVLLRARAIENQVFVLAPAQHGRHPSKTGNRVTYGKSVIVDPWGDVLAQCAEGEGFALAQLDFAAQDRVRASLPCLTHRRL